MYDGRTTLVILCKMLCVCVVVLLVLLICVVVVVGVVDKWPVVIVAGDWVYVKCLLLLLCMMI